MKKWKIRLIAYVAAEALLLGNSSSFTAMALAAESEESGAVAAESSSAPAAEQSAPAAETAPFLLLRD